jgi:hypothetical protein
MAGDTRKSLMAAGRKAPAYLQLNSRDEKIWQWVAEYRPDCLNHVEDIFEASNSAHADRPALAARMLMCMVFEAGRLFQHERPDAPLDNPNIYLEAARG